MSIKQHFQFLIVVLLFGVSSCGSEEVETILAPTSDDIDFTYSIDPENPNLISFSGETTFDTWYTHWNFGDNTSAEGFEAEKLFFNQGDYDVQFKIFTEGGTAIARKTISIENDIQVDNLIENGSFDDDSSWSILSISGGAEVNISDGKATWTGGGWGHVGIFQTMDVKANVEYQIQMDVAGSGMSDCWFEVYVGMSAPVDGFDYTDGGIRLGLNTWDGCGAEPFDGPLTALSCSNGGGDGSFVFPNDATVYLVIRSGGANLGDAGVSVDNIFVLEK